MAKNMPPLTGMKGGASVKGQTPPGGSHSTVSRSPVKGRLNKMKPVIPRK